MRGGERERGGDRGERGRRALLSPSPSLNLLPLSILSIQRALPLSSPPPSLSLSLPHTPSRRRAASLLPPSATPPLLPFRVGHGFDLHRLEEGPHLKLILGGITIPHDRGCVAHSDGDALLHTVTDAILGALARPDIGQLFPDTDPKWKGATSDVFVREAVRLMHGDGYELGNIDVTVILQRPKVRGCRGREVEWRE